MTVTVFSEGKHPGEFIIAEDDDGFLSREAVVIDQNQTIVPGEVLGRMTIGSAMTISVAAGAANTGGGNCTGATGLDGGQDGTYKAVCIATATGSGTFSVSDPSGVELGVVAVGATFANQVRFSIADGTPDYELGDEFSIVLGVEFGADSRWGALDTTATNGMQKAAGIAVYGATMASGATGPVAAIVRHAAVRAADLTWPGGITTAQKKHALEELRALGIVAR